MTGRKRAAASAAEPAPKAARRPSPRAKPKASPQPVGDPPAEMALMRATEVSGRVVVSIAEGEAIADVKDVLYSPELGRLTGITLNKHGGIFAGPLKVGLQLSQLHAIGRHAVTVASSGVLEEEAGEQARAEADKHRNVLGNEVLTDAGDSLGVVTDLVLHGGVVGVGSASASPGDVVGYQLRPNEANDKDPGHEEFVPLPYTLAVSGSHLVVPAEVRPFITQDLSGFGGSVEAFRAQLGSPPAPAAGSTVTS